MVLLYHRILPYSPDTGPDTGADFWQVTMGCRGFAAPASLSDLADIQNNHDDHHQAQDKLKPISLWQFVDTLGRCGTHYGEILEPMWFQVTIFSGHLSMLEIFSYKALNSP